MGILQWHSCLFWVGAIGTTGYAWSLTLETVQLWLWSRHGGIFITAVALATTLVLLAGPLYDVSTPILQEFSGKHSAAIAAAKEKAVVERAIAEKQRELATFLEIAKTRLGWQKSIEQGQAALVSLRSRLRALQTQTAKQNAFSRALDYQHVAIVLLQAVCILIFQFASVLAIRSLSARPNPGPDISATNPGTFGNNGHRAHFDPHARDLVSSLQARVAREQAKGKTRAQIAQDHGLSPKYITYILNYEQYGPTRPPLSLNQLRRLDLILA